MTVAQTFTGTGASTDPDADRIAWHHRRMLEVEAGTYQPKSPTPDTEPLPGWKPFAGYGTDDPAAIIAKAARDRDEQGMLALIPGDHFDVTVDGHPMRYRLAGFDHYYDGRINKTHHALMIPDRVYPQKIAWNAGGATGYSSSGLHQWEEDTYYSTLPKTVRDLIVPMSVLYGDGDTYFETTSSSPYGPAHVFSPGVVELFGAPFSSAEKVLATGSDRLHLGTGYVDEVPNHWVLSLFRSVSGAAGPLSGVTTVTWPNHGTGDDVWYWTRTRLGKTIFNNTVVDSSNMACTVSAGRWAIDDTENITALGYPLPCICIG